MAIDPNNPLLNGPKRVDATVNPVKDYKALYERAMKRQQVLEEQVRSLQEQLDGKSRRPVISAQQANVRKARLTEADIERGKSPKGGWTRKTLAGWGISWPPPKGWKENLLKANR
jgi:hypothetical protein